jgi:hypothetical protein
MEVLNLFIQHHGSSTSFVEEDAFSDLNLGFDLQNEEGAEDKKSDQKAKKIKLGINFTEVVKILVK